MSILARKAPGEQIAAPLSLIADLPVAFVARSEDTSRKTLGQVAEALSAFGVEMVDVAGAITSANAASSGLLEAFGQLSQMAEETQVQTGVIRQAVTSTMGVTDQLSQAMAMSREALLRASQDTGTLVVAVSQINSQLQGLQSPLGSVSQVFRSIDQIARQTLCWR
jgi:methyl-accepting chemotaxis protein